MLEWLCNIRTRAIISSGVAAGFVGENLRLGWGSDAAIIRGSILLSVYNVFDIFAGGLHWNRAEHILHHSAVVIGCGYMLSRLLGSHSQGGTFSHQEREMLQWLSLSEITTIFNGIRVAYGGQIWNRLFAGSFLIIRPIASAGVIRVIMSKGSKFNDRGVIIPLVSCFVGLNSYWCYKVLQRLVKYQ